MQPAARRRAKINKIPKIDKAQEQAEQQPTPLHGEKI